MVDTVVDTVVLEPTMAYSMCRYLSTRDLRHMANKRILTGVRVPEWPPGVDRLYLALGYARVLVFHRDDWVDLKDMLNGFTGIPLGLMEYHPITFEVEPSDITEIVREEIVYSDEDDDDREVLTDDGRIMRGKLLPKKKTRTSYEGMMPGLVLEFMPAPPVETARGRASDDDDHAASACDRARARARAPVVPPVDIDIIQRVRIRTSLVGDPRYARLIHRVLPGTERDDDTVEAYCTNKLRFMDNSVRMLHCPLGDM